MSASELTLFSFLTSQKPINPTPFALLTQCSAGRTSICPLGETFPNKHDEKNIATAKNFLGTFTDPDKLLDTATDRELTYPIFVEMMESAIKSIFKLTGWPKIYTDNWQLFIRGLCPVTFSNGMRLQNAGHCHEASLQVVKLNLLRQIKTGDRENIHKIQLLEGYEHEFVVLNAKNIGTVVLANSSPEAFEKWLDDLEPNDPNRQITICDPWLGEYGYHGPITKTFFNLLRKHHDSTKRELQINIENFTMPGLRVGRDEYNPLFRRFVKTLMSWLLTIFDNVPPDEIRPYIFSFIGRDLEHPRVMQLLRAFEYFEENFQYGAQQADEVAQPNLRFR